MGGFKLNNLRKSKLNKNFRASRRFFGQKPCAGAPWKLFWGGGHLRSKNPNI